MDYLRGVLVPLAALGLIALASKEFGALFRRWRLPLISGFLVCGALAGPDLLGLVSRTGVERLSFVDHIAIAFIGFLAGSELYLAEFRDRIRPILWVILGIVVMTLPLVAWAFFELAHLMPGIRDAGPRAILAAALLAGSILVARSPSSAIAIIKELRAWGPFTRLGLGATVILDAVVITLFTVSAEVAEVLLHGGGGIFGTVVLLALEFLASVLIGILLGQLLRLVMVSWSGAVMRLVLVLLIGWGVFAAAGFLRHGGLTVGGNDVILEPLLICMVAGVFIANRTRHRSEFHRLLDRGSPIVFVVFFTLTGASVSLEVLARSWPVALALFGVRLGAIMVGTFGGGLLAGEPMRESRLLWMSFVTQAGVGLGLAKEVALEFPGWGQELATVVIAVIVINQLVGPPLERWVLKAVREAHPRAEAAGFGGVRDVLIFGHEGQAMALAQQLHENGWQVKLAAWEGAQFEDPGERGFEVVPVWEISREVLEELDAGRAECVVSLLDDETNYRICELVYEHFGTDNLIVRAQEPTDLQRFHDLEAVVVEPSTAMISLLDQLVRSPRSTSLLLGLEEGRGVVEFQVGNPNLHQLPLRELSLPADALVLSLRRGANTLITHGDTELRVGDWVTVLGSDASLAEVAVRVEGEVRGRRSLAG